MDPRDRHPLGTPFNHPNEAIKARDEGRGAFAAFHSNPLDFYVWKDANQASKEAAKLRAIDHVEVHGNLVIAGDYPSLNGQHQGLVDRCLNGG